MDSIVATLKEFSVSICVTLVIATFLMVLILAKFSLTNKFRKRKTNEEIDDQSRPHLSSLETDTDDTLTEARHKRFSQEQTTCSPRYPDPVDYCEHIQGEIKRVQQTVATRSIAKRLTEEQLKEEREVQRKQLAEIFRLMQEQQDRFGIGSMDDMQEQMKLYAVQ